MHELELRPYDRIESTTSEGGLTYQQKREWLVGTMINVGFGADEIQFVVRDGISAMMMSQNHLLELSEESFKWMLKVFNPEQRKTGLWYSLALYSEPQLKKELVDSVNEFALKASEDETLDDRLKTYLDAVKFGQQSDTTSASQKKLTVGLKCVSNKHVLSMFDDDINKLAEFVAVESVVDTTLVLDKLKKIAVMQNGHIFSKDLPFAKFREQLISLEHLEGILLDEGLSAAFNKYLRSDRTWADRVEVFNDVVRSRGENVADGIEANPKVIERMRKRENPRHPAVSLGIAKTNGYEVEYDSIKNPVVQRLKKNNTFDYLYTLGFKYGTGDMNSGKADETSPGPFYDPQTAAIVYLLYANAKIIDTSMFVGSTFHFNIDNSVDDDDIVPIIRGLYLTGAALSPYHDSERDTLATVNHKDERRTEGKVFGVNTDADFVWTMISAANLCFAKAASKNESDSPGREYRDALGQIWEEYVQRMEKGLEYVNKKGYLYERRLRVVTQDEVGHKFLTPEPNGEWVKDQLKKVFTDRTYAAYPDLKRAGQQNPAQQTGDGVRGIFEEPSKWHPNIAVFSRTVINEAVSGVQKVIRKIETDCLQDIREIDSLQDEEKWAKLYNFVHKYNVDIGKEGSDADIEKAYSEVRELMIQGEDGFENG